MEAGQRREGGGGAGAAEVEAKGATGGAGGTHVLSCASACLCLGGMQSHMKEAFFFSPPTSPRLGSGVRLKSATVPLLTHYLSAD